MSKNFGRPTLRVIALYGTAPSPLATECRAIAALGLAVTIAGARPVSTPTGRKSSRGARAASFEADPGQAG